MKLDSFGLQIGYAQQRLCDLQRLVNAHDPFSQTLLNQLINELRNAMEELQVASEEMQAQHEELVVIRQALEIEQEKYQELFEHAPDGYVVTTAEGIIQQANLAAEKLLNLNRRSLIGVPLSVFVVNNDHGNFYNSLKTLLDSSYISDIEFNLQPREREAFTASISVSPICNVRDAKIGLRWLIRDISDRKKIVEQIIHDAFHDSLTGLSNRELLNNRLEHALSRFKRHPSQLFSLLFIDLDRFKLINDSLGHLAGDLLLIEVASRLKQCVREEDTLARLGGDEFVLLLNEVQDATQAEACAYRIQALLSEPFTLCNDQVIIQPSIGIVVSSPHYQQPSEIIRDADLAMYQAKRKGGGRFQFFTAEMLVSTLEKFNLEQDLLRAVQERQFEIYYQPIIKLVDQELVGFEALVRWHHPQRGLMLPAKFLSVAESSRLIVLIDLWMLRTACQQMTIWKTDIPSASSLIMSVNVSSHLFEEATLITQVHDILQETGLDPKCLALEITEGVIMANVEQATLTMTQLYNLQIRLTIDDFGTGYSSLSRLQHLPLHGLKIDRSFLREPKGIEIVKSILLLAKTLGLYVVAEGVESLTMMQKLVDCGCDYAQGYYFGFPENGKTATLNISSHISDSVCRF